MKIKLLTVITLVVLLLLGLFLSPIFSSEKIGVVPLTDTLTVAQSEKLVEDVNLKMKELQDLVTKAQKEGINTLKEETSLRTAEIFMIYADWDSKNIETNRSLFELVSIFKDSADMYSKMLPDFERNEILIMLNSSISELQRVLDGEIVRLETPRVDWTKTTVENGSVLFEGEPVFLADWIWKPQDKFFNEYHGAMCSGLFWEKTEGGFFLTPSFVVDQEGTLAPHKLKEAQELETATMGSIFLDHHDMPEWAVKKDSTINDGPGAHYVSYDINNPLARDVTAKLLSGFVPYLKGTNRSKLGYMLCNEPHWNTLKGTWASSPLSGYAAKGFKKWLEAKHKTVGRLNELWGTSFSSFSAVEVPTIMTKEQQGTAVYFDFMTYNMARVTEWFSFLTSEIKKHDPEAKTHIKLIPDMWGSGSTDHGLDFETLTRNSDIIGNDGGTCRAPIWGDAPAWAEDFDFNWQNLCMNYDFFKSISPEKAMYNSEAHFLSKLACRDLYLTPQYTRCNYWLGAVYGMDVVQGWYWSRYADGKPMGGGSYAGSNCMQPRVVNEVHTTIADLNSVADIIKSFQNQRKSIRIFHSNASSINDSKYMGDISELYRNLAFEGVPMGFVTKGIFTHSNSSDWDVVVVYQTPKVFAEDIEKLQNYLDNGGVVIIDQNSLKSDEYGADLKHSLKSSKGTLISCSSLGEIKAKTFEQIVLKEVMPKIQVTQENGRAQKGCLWRVVDGGDGSFYLNIANVGKNEAKVEISLPNSGSFKVVNGLTMEKFNTSFTMQPCDLHFLKIEKSI